MNATADVLEGRKKPRNTFIDYVRLGLALAVVAGHLHPYWTSPIPFFWPRFAVPAFLAISGYYVLQSYERSSSWSDFAIKRVLRVVPAFAISLIIVWFAGGLPALGDSLLRYATLDHAGTLRASGMPIGNSPLWSLSLEELSYAALAVLFTLGMYRRVWPIWIAFVIALGVSFYAWQYQWGSLVAEPLPSFFAGSLIYLYRDKLKSSVWVLGVASFVAGMILTRPSFTMFGASCIGCVLVGVGLLLASKGLKGLPAIPDVSYGIYVYHMPLAIAFGASINPLLYVPLLFALSIGSWYLIEKPALKLKNWHPRRKARVPEVKPPEPVTFRTKGTDWWIA
jgi:peptidoglycan/LPS O-acetylase OafA/YrhL